MKCGREGVGGGGGTKGGNLNDLVSSGAPAIRYKPIPEFPILKSESVNIKRLFQFLYFTCFATESCYIIKRDHLESKIIKSCMYSEFSYLTP